MDKIQIIFTTHMDIKTIKGMFLKTLPDQGYSVEFYYKSCLWYTEIEGNAELFPFDSVLNTIKRNFSDTAIVIINGKMNDD